MSAQTTTTSTFPLPTMWPSGYGNYGPGYDPTLLESINNVDRNITAEINSVSKDIVKDISQSTLGLRDSIERGNSSINNGLERTAAVTQSAIERNAGEGRLITVTTDAASRQAAADTARDIMRAVDKNGSEGITTSERIGSNISSAIERNAGESRLTTVTTDAASRQSAADIARDIMRAVDRNGADATNTSERIGSQISSAIERNAGESRLTTVTTDAASRQSAADGVRDISVAVERTSGSCINATNTSYAGLLGSVERNSGENRVSAMHLDSASQARLADTRRDIIAQLNNDTSLISTSVEKNGSDIRNQVANSAWESRTGIANGFAASMLEQSKNTGLLANKLGDIYASGLLEQQKAKESVLERLDHQYASTLLEHQKAKESVLGRLDHQYAATQLELQKSKYDASIQSANHHSELLLEQQRVKEYLSSKGDSHFAVSQLEQQKSKSELANQAASHYSELLLEQQKVKEYLSSKGDNHFAMNQLELQKVKSDLSSQASTHFSINQLEQQKLGATISAQLADAKYEALKTQQTLADKMAECCCEVKEKIDLVDRDRLRDSLNSEKNDNNMQKILELNAAAGRFDPLAPGYGPFAAGYGPGFAAGYGPGYGPGYNFGPSYQNGPGNGNGDVNIYSYEGRRRRGHRRSYRSRSRSHSHSRSRSPHHRS